MYKILIIEDEDTIRDNIIEFLLSENFEVVEARNGQTGIQLAHQHQLDLILCDIMMPDCDGYTVISELQKQSQTAKIPFIFLTAKSERDDMRLGMELGADDYLTKPFTPMELLSSIRARLKKQQHYLSEYAIEWERANGLKKKVSELEQISKTREELLIRVVEELRNPMSNISLAIQMLQMVSSNRQDAVKFAARQQHYLKILQEECARELAILNQISELHHLLTPENLSLMRKFNLLEDKTHD